MSELAFQLFGKFTVLSGGEPIHDLGSGKAQELLAYLLVYRERPQPRESLAELLWEASSSGTAKKYLRQALWQMQQALPVEQLIENQPDWIGISDQADFRLDVAEFEQAFARAHGVPGPELQPEVAAELERAAGMYCGDLLEGWYSDWCIFERERLQNIWLAMLDKLISYCESQGNYEAGRAYGMQVLRSDRARERTHRQLMRMAYLAGDRTGALRQYQRCAKALEEELGVRPSRRTEALHRRLLSDSEIPVGLSDSEILLAPHRGVGPAETLDAGPADQALGRSGNRVNELRDLLNQLRSRINEDLDALDHALSDAE